MYTLNANLLKHPLIHTHIHQIVKQVAATHKAGETAVACVKKLKHEVRKYLKKETRIHAKKTNNEIDGVEARLRSLHTQQRNRQTAAGIRSRKVLQNRLVILRSTLRPPRASASRFRHLKEECMSR